MDKFEHIRIALQSRDDELLTKLLNQRCVQLRAIGMAKETKLDFGGIKYKRGQDLFKTAERIFLKLNLCSGGGKLEQWVWELNEVNLGIRFPTAVKARAAVSVDIQDADTDTIKLMLERLGACPGLLGLAWGPPFGAPGGPLWGPLGAPFGAPLGPLWGPLGAPFGAPWGPLWGPPGGPFWGGHGGPPGRLQFSQHHVSF